MNESELLQRVVSEYETNPPIARLDEYIHMREQLEAMRARNGNQHSFRFAMELAVLFRLNDYDDLIGMPLLVMPHPDGQGGVAPEPVIPVEWLS